MESSSEPKRSMWEYGAKAISYVFHPFLMPVWMIVLMFGTGLMPVYLPAGVRNYVLTVVLINALLVPTIGIVLLKVFGIISDYSLASRHDRNLPILVVILCYGTCVWMLGSAPMFFVLKRIMVAAMLSAALALVVNLRWQISLHMTAMGAAVGVIFIMLIAGYAGMVWYLCGALLCTGLLASARLYLGKHTPAQVTAGFFSGFCIAVLVLLLWN